MKGSHHHFSLGRVVALTGNTFTGLVRLKVFCFLLLFGLLLIGSSLFMAQLTFQQEFKILKDVSLGAMSIFTSLLAIVATAQLIPRDIEDRTIYTILAKPVRRAEFLLGKFLGVVLLLALCVALMSLAFAVTLYWQESIGLATVEASYGTAGDWQHNAHATEMHDNDVAHIISQVRDPQLVEAILLIFAKIIMTAAIALLISTFATSWIFTVITTFLIYLIGHGESLARIYWLAHGAETTIWQSGLIGLIALLIPDMNSFTIVDEILAGHQVPWHDVLNLLCYANVYVIVLLAVSVVVFDYREL